MLRSLPAWLLAGFLGFPGLASACINDAELETHEREFRSRYNQKLTPPTRTLSPDSATPVDENWLVWTGSVLLLGAGGIALGGRWMGR